MYSVKKKKSKDRIIQDTCGAIEDYLRDSEQKDTYKKCTYLPYKNYKITYLKNIVNMPTLEEDNFTDILKKYNNSYISKGNALNEIDIAFKPIMSKSLASSENLREKEEVSRGDEKYELLEDGSICIKNTTGMISPSLGEKYLELKHSNNDINDININKDIDQDILVNSKLFISNNIKYLEEDDNYNYNYDEENIINNNSSYNNNSLIKNRNNIFTINDDADIMGNDNINSHLNNCKSLKNLYRDNKDNNFVYFSTSKKNKIKSKNNKTNISTNVKKKKLIVKAQTQTKNKNINRNNIFDIGSNEENNIKNNNNFFLKEIKINPKNNELNSKRILFGDNFKEEDEIINLWKYLCNRYIKEYNKKLLSTNIQIITQNLKIKKILETKDKNKQKIYKNNNKIIPGDNNNYFDSIKEEYNNIGQDNISKSINAVEYNNKNELSDSDFAPESTNISHILKPPIENFGNTYEKFFDEIDIVSEKNIKNINKYKGEIESINEEMNESYEEQELSDKKKYHNNKQSKLKLKNPIKDTTKINFNINKIITNFNNIDNIYSMRVSQNDKKSPLYHSPKSSINNKNNFISRDKGNKYSPCPSMADSEDISISRETETEISDEEIIYDENGKISQHNYNNSLINKYLSYKIEKKNNYIRLIFGENNNNIYNKRYSINIKSYKKILKMIFLKKKKPITKNSYEKLLYIIINNFSIFKREYSLRKNKKVYNNQEKEILNNNCIQVNNKINELEEKVKEMKYYYIYGLVKKHLIKDKYDRKKFVKSLKIGEKRNRIKRIYKEIIHILNNKINDSELNVNFYEKMIDILKKYEKINEDEIIGFKNKYIKDNINIGIDDIIKIENNKNNLDKIDIYNKQKIFVFLLPVMFIINYLANNFKVYGYNDLI